MDKRSLLFTALALAVACRCAPALAEENGDHRVGAGIHEVADDELADMRGRYIVGDNTVLWFGVEMVSTWQTSNGQTLQSALTLAMNFSKNPNQPQVTFVPTVTIDTIGQVSGALPTPTASNASRSVQSAGLANVSGVTQSVQIAGDHNAAANVTSLNIQNGGSVPTPAANTSASASTPSSNTPPSSTVAAASPAANVVVTGSTVNASSSTASIVPGSGNTPSSNATQPAAPALANTTPSVVTTSTGTSTSNGRVASVGDASASSTYSNDSAQVTLSVKGQGTVSQWIRPGSLGQTIALTADNQVVTNQMIVSMVTQSISTTTSQLAHNLAQSLNLNHANR